MKDYSVRTVSFNNHKRVFSVRVSGRPDEEYLVPYRFVGLDELVETVAPDEEIGNHGFTWRARSGGEGTMLAEQVLHMHRDPEVIRTHLLHELSVRAERLRQDRGISAAVLAELSGTTPARVCHLLKPNTYKNKSVWAMLRLLIVLGDDIDQRLLDAVNASDAA
ncbi:MAG: hypothetical protein GKS06_00100 [Acidobacteria bacterium]|nr:hypothetical protein [Acidobacteriota bacterium]